MDRMKPIDGSHFAKSFGLVIRKFCSWVQPFQFPLGARWPLDPSVQVPVHMAQHCALRLSQANYAAVPWVE